MIRSVEAGDYIPKSSEEGRRAIAIYRADSIQRNLAAAASDYAAAVAAEDWRVLDYDSVATWAADVLAISGLNRVMAQREQINDSWRTMLDSEGKYPDRAAYEKALHTFISKHWAEQHYLDPDVIEALSAFDATEDRRLWKALGLIANWPYGELRSRPPAGGAQ